MDPESGVGGFPKWVHVGTFFAFFSNVFLTSIFLRFFFDFGGVLEAKMASKIDFWRGFWDAFWAPSFLIEISWFFNAFFDARPFKNGDFP